MLKSYVIFSKNIILPAYKLLCQDFRSYAAGFQVRNAYFTINNKLKIWFFDNFKSFLWHIGNGPAMSDIALNVLTIYCMEAVHC